MLIEKKYIDVVLPLPLEGTFTYYTDKELSIGQRVVVQFGVRKLYTGLVQCIHNNKPLGYKTKPLLAILDEAPIVNEVQLKFWQWISDYYMCELGDVMNAALPAYFKLASESVIIIHPEFDGDIDHLSLDEITLLNILSDQESLSIADILKNIDLRNIFSFINELIRKEIIQIQENLHDKYKLKEIKVVKYIGSKKKIANANLTKKQEIFILDYLKLEDKFESRKWVISDLLNEVGFSRSIFNTLVRKGFFIIENQSVSRLLESSAVQVEEKKLADFQEEALAEIKDSFKEKDVCLLHGVTSSGKTEVYIKLINEQLEMGRQVLYLLPEIALTNQIVSRLQEHFGNKVGVTHSHLSNSERVEVWRAVQENNKLDYSVIIGARSSLFLPFYNLGLIIIDEEHDSSFKQHQPAPRYHARDSAIYLAYLHHAKVLLGSATPSVETYYNTKNKKYGLVEMHKRFKGIALPKINTIDIRKAHLKKQMKSHFSPDMLSAIKRNLEERKQVILFQNRRGYSPVLSCNACGHTSNCTQCDVSLTFHKSNRTLRCHYCGYSTQMPDQCPSCNAHELNDKGIGTEQIEEILKGFFPENVIKRMDYDTTRGKNAHQSIITDFEKGRIDILVGTQMVTKGLDFDNVAMVGILNADSMLYFPDFRAYERAFQLMMQVAGRAGRKGKQGQVLIQTYDEEHEIFKMLKRNDFISFIKSQSHERKLFGYPPYTRIISITLKHKNQQKLDIAALSLGIVLRRSFGERVLGPEYPVVSRIRNYYHKNLLLKIEQKSSINQAKVILSSIIKKIREQDIYKSIRVIIDVDPI